MEVMIMAKVRVSLEAVLRVAEIAIEKRLDGPGACDHEVEFNPDGGEARIYKVSGRSRVSVEVVPLD
jgi:hypothetical protein